MSLKRLIFILLLSAAALNALAAERSPRALDRFINRAIEEGQFPGAQVVVGNSEGVIYSNCYGHKNWCAESKVDSASIYDLASITKVFSTTLAVMRLSERGELSLLATLGELLPLSDTLAQSTIRVEELLYHTSGFAPGLPIGMGLVTSADPTVDLFSRRKRKSNPHLFDASSYLADKLVYDTIYLKKRGGEQRIYLSDSNYLQSSFHAKMDSMAIASFRPEQRGRHIYSDLNFYLLQKIIEQITATPLDKYVEAIYREMEITQLGYNPLNWAPLEQICPTEYDLIMRRDTIRGHVHDELVSMQGGVGGSAGLFGSALDAAKICGMFLRNGVDYNQRRIIDSATLANFTQIVRSPLPTSNSVYALGFTKIDNPDRPYTPQSYGHSGYTGTYFWIDPTCDLYLVVLTNRVHPTRTNKKFNPDTRAKLWEITAEIFEGSSQIP